MHLSFESQNSLIGFIFKFTDKSNMKKKGQAVVEYILILVGVVSLALAFQHFIGEFKRFTEGELFNEGGYYGQLLTSTTVPGLTTPNNEYPEFTPSDYTDNPVTFGDAPTFGTPPTFGSPPEFGEPARFGAPPVFGAGPTFGSPPRFGTSPRFGAPPTFGTPPAFGDSRLGGVGGGRYGRGGAGGGQGGVDANGNHLFAANSPNGHGIGGSGADGYGRDGRFGGDNHSRFASGGKNQSNGIFGNNKNQSANAKNKKQSRGSRKGKGKNKNAGVIKDSSSQNDGGSYYRRSQEPSRFITSMGHLATQQEENMDREKPIAVSNAKKEAPAPTAVTKQLDTLPKKTKIQVMEEEKPLRFGFMMKYLIIFLIIGTVLFFIGNQAMQMRENLKSV